MRRGNFTYYFKEESVTLVIKKSQPIGNSYISFNSYTMLSKKRFKDFKEELATCKRNEYGNINDIYGLAHRHGVGVAAGHKPKVRIVNGRIAF